MTNLTKTRRKPEQPTIVPDSRARRSVPSRAAAKPIDARIEARRTEVAETEARRRRQNFLALSAVTVLGIVAFGLARSPVADVDGFEVAGAVHADPTDIAMATGITMGQPLLEVDAGAAEAGVEGLPWVLEADVERHWNGQVSVQLTEREPVATLPSAAGGWISVDTHGIQLEAMTEQPGGDMPVSGITVSGVPGEPVSVDAHRALQVLAALDPELRAQTASVSAVGPDVSLELVQGGSVRLGSELGLSEKLDAARTMLAKADLRCLHEIDVRVPASPALSRVDAEGYPLAAVADLAQCA